jgi:DNA-binding response OmpR family regulator
MIKPRILIVDDEKETRETIADFLNKRFNCEADVKSNGSEAISALDEKEYHILFQDLHMPGIGGFDVIEHAKRKKTDMIVFVITKWDDPSYTKRIEELGAVYIPKPVALKVVQMLVEKALAEKGVFDYKR